MSGSHGGPHVTGVTAVFCIFFVKMLGLVTHQHSASQSCMIIVWEKTLQSTWDYRENSGFLNLPDYWVKIPVSAVVCHELSERRWWRWHCTWAEYMKRWTALTVCILCAVECIHCLPALFTCVWFCYTVCPVMNKKYYPPCTHTTTKQNQKRKHKKNYSVIYMSSYNQNIYKHVFIHCKKVNGGLFNKKLEEKNELLSGIWIFISTFVFSHLPSYISKYLPLFLPPFFVPSSPLPPFPYKQMRD